MTNPADSAAPAPLVMEDPHRAREIFFPHTQERSRDLRANETARVAYYTTAETAFHVLRNKEFWLRNTATMNDYSEVEHGFACLKAAYDSEAGKHFQSALDLIFPSLTRKAVERFDSWLPTIRQDTYIACFSEHLSTEDQNGRLSMWRAYGGRAGVALILKPDVLFAENDGIGVFASPVAYWTQQQVEAELRRIADRIASDSEYVRSLGEASVEATVFAMFKFAVLCTKHPGFAEEREWRVIASPAMYKSPLLNASVELVKGMPQTVQKVALREYPEIGLNSLRPHLLIDRIIVGPCDYPLVIWKALNQLLTDCGIENAGSRIFVSEIPLRAPSA